MLCLSGFELYSPWVPLSFGGGDVIQKIFILLSTKI